MMTTKINENNEKDLEVDAKEFEEESIQMIKDFRNIFVVTQPLLKNERKRLIKKFGSDHPRTRRLDSKLKFTVNVVKNLDARLEETSELTPPGQWVVKGVITGENGKGMAGVTVSLYDKDLLFDDYLGTRITDENGNFEFAYQEEGFKDLLEKKPDIYLKVLDKKGKPIFSSKKAVKCGAGRIEVFNIKIEDLGKTKAEFPIPPEVKKKK
jgi:hypothetical protein